ASRTINQSRNMNSNRSLSIPAAIILTILSCSGIHNRLALAGNSIWTGGGTDGKWQTPNNWQGNTPPGIGDALFFTCSVRLNNENNFTAGSVFNGITFSSPASAFNLFGNSITLTNDVVDNQVSVNETLNLPILLNATHNMNVISNGTLTLSGSISGTAGLSKT